MALHEYRRVATSNRFVVRTGCLEPMALRVPAASVLRALRSRTLTVSRVGDGIRRRRSGCTGDTPVAAGGMPSRRRGVDAEWASFGDRDLSDSESCTSSAALRRSDCCSEASDLSV